MEVIYRRSAGLDVHRGEIAACVRVTTEGEGVRAQGRRFPTTPAGLRDLCAWVVSEGVTHVAMEATGVYWLPVYRELEAAGLDLTLCNAHHVKNVPGRKTDQSDAAWLAQLMASGLLRKSFVPDAQVRQVRELTRARVHLIEDRTRAVNALHRLLERAGLKLCSVVSDLQGKSARAIMRAVVDGQTDVAWAGLAPGQRESAGKRKHAGTRDGNVYLRRILVQAARIWVILRRDVAYAPPPPKPPSERQKARRIMRALSTLQSLGYFVGPNLPALPNTAAG